MKRYQRGTGHLAVNDQASSDAGNGGGVRQRSRASIERRILEAAESVFAEAGFNGATTAEIARRAGIPKANLHYYFNTKEELYQQVLTGIVNSWLHTADEITPDADPARALSHYIMAKIDLAREQPIPSRVFANEVIHGAPHLGKYLERAAQLGRGEGQGHARLDRRRQDARGRPQASAVHDLGQHPDLRRFRLADFRSARPRSMTPQEYKAVSRQMTEIIFRGCGLTPPAQS